MSHGLRRCVSVGMALILGTALSIPAFAAPKKGSGKTAQMNNTEVLTAMKKAADFMENTVSNRGGFLSNYSADFSEQWGEIPARKSQIMVQDPGTVMVGEMFLDVYKATGDPLYLNYAKRAADALVYGQYPAGGWHYFIDFDMPGVRKYYDEVASKCWGWEEYYHYYGNCTFDDSVTSGATWFLLHVYMTTLDPTYRAPLIKALNFILAAQYPNGGWPQRFPLSFEYPHDGHGDYTSYYTYNDDVIQGNIHLLMAAFEQLGNEEYQKAAYRGMDFLIISQLPSPQAGWGQQYDLNMKSAPARSYEPASVMPGQTVTCIRDLELFYKMTGDRKYLRGIPDAIKWLEDSVINTDKSKGYTHATFYELGTDKPLYPKRTGTTMENGHYYYDYEFYLLNHYGSVQTFDIPSIKREYERVNALTPDQARAEYQARKAEKPRVPAITAETVQKLISSLDNRGAWVTEMKLPPYNDPINGKPRVLQGIDTEVFVNNMRTLLNFVLNQKSN